jgi:hypothetical protein
MKARDASDFSPGRVGERDTSDFSPGRVNIAKRWSLALQSGGTDIGKRNVGRGKLT